MRQLLLPQSPEQEKDFETLINSLKQCARYHNKKKTIANSLGAISILLLFASMASTTLNDEGLGIGLFFCFMLLFFLCVYAWLAFDRCPPPHCVFTLANTPEWDKVYSHLEQVPQTVAGLTKNSAAIDQLGEALLELKYKTFEILMREIPEAHDTTAEEIKKLAIKLWHLPDWIFHSPIQQLNQASYLKIDRELDSLFSKQDIPYSIVGIITGFVFPAPNFSPPNFAKKI